MIRMSLFRRTGRTMWEVQWMDPVTGRKRTKSTGKATRREAETERARLELQLAESRGKIRDKTSWSAFVERLTEELLDQRSQKHRKKVLSVLAMFAKCVKPSTAAVITDDEISDFTRWMRKRTFGPKEAKRRISESTIKSNLACLRLALKWGAKFRFLRFVPQIEMPRGTERPKARAATREEFERMLTKLEKIVGAENLPGWKFLMEGLWWGGLRSGESLRLSWDQDEPLCIDLTGEYPVFRIEASSDKGLETRTFPVSPGFARLLKAVPEEEQRGPVFRPAGLIAGEAVSQQQVERVIRQCGIAACVRVAKHKHASAHDFRRAFGTRWAPRVKPAVLQQMMRHKNIHTTMTFYAQIDAQDIAAEVWHHEKDTSAGPANTLANTPASVAFILDD